MQATALPGLRPHRNAIGDGKPQQLSHRVLTYCIPWQVNYARRDAGTTWVLPYSR
jgi:hypothetical protein